MTLIRARLYTIDSQVAANDSDTLQSIETLSPRISPLSPFVFEFLGRLHFQLGYDFRSSTLNLKLICAESLPAKDFSGTSDPYVKIMLLPDRKHQLVSNIKRKSLNPRWNELFAFEGCALILFIVIRYSRVCNQEVKVEH